MDWNKPLEMLCGGMWGDVKVVLTPSDSKDNGAYGVTNGHNIILFTKEGTRFGEFNSSRAWYQPANYKIRNKKETVTVYEWRHCYGGDAWADRCPASVIEGDYWVKTGRSKEIEL